MALMNCQILNVSSSDAEAGRSPSGEKAIELTCPSCPVNVWRHLLVGRCQILMVLSYDPDARHIPSGEKATQVTLSVWPESVRAWVLKMVAGLLTESREPG